MNRVPLHVIDDPQRRDDMLHLTGVLLHKLLTIGSAAKCIHNIHNICPIIRDHLPSFLEGRIEKKTKQIPAREQTLGTRFNPPVSEWVSDRAYCAARRALLVRASMSRCSFPWSSFAVPRYQRHGRGFNRRICKSICVKFYSFKQCNQPRYGNMIGSHRAACDHRRRGVINT